MKESRVLLLIWQLTLGLSLLEIGFGIFLGSLGLISDGVHTAANCLGVGTSLFVVKWAKSLATRSYAFDLSARAEVLAAFTNSVILLLLSAFLAFEALHQLVEAAHHSDHSDHVAVVALAGIVVNFIGLVLVTPLIGGWKTLIHRLTSQQDEAEGPRLLNLEAVALHITFDIVSSLGVIASTILAENGFHAADSLIAVLIAGLTVRGASPMFRRTSKMLAQAAPGSLKTDALLRELASVDGVLEFYQAHFWSLAPSRDVGSLIIRVRSDADEDYVMKAAHRILSPHMWNLTVQLEREKPIHSLLVTKQQNASSSVTQVMNEKATSAVGLREAAHIL